MWATVWPAATAQPAIAQIALHPLRQVEEAVLKHVRGVDPTIKPRVHAELDHPSQPVAVPLEQVGQRPAIPGSEPLEQVDGFTRWVVHDLAHTLWLARGRWFGTRKMVGARQLVRGHRPAGVAPSGPRGGHTPVLAHQLASAYKNSC